MATCPSGHTVTGGKRYCGDCGADMLGQTPPASSASPASPTPAEAKKTNGCAVMVVLFVIVVGFFALLSALGVGDDDDDDPEVTGAVAFEMCKDFVRERLRSPGSAVFRNYYEDDGEVLVIGSGKGPYTISSSVDSENGFGALLRTDFSCTVTNTVGDTWTLDDLTIEE